MGAVHLRIASVPVCPGCATPLLPQELNFDTRYESHGIYRWAEALCWFGAAYGLVFVSTSFAVNVTLEALLHASAASTGEGSGGCGGSYGSGRSCPMFNSNIRKEGALSWGRVLVSDICALPEMEVYHVLGRSKALARTAPQQNRKQGRAPDVGAN